MTDLSPAAHWSNLMTDFRALCVELHAAFNTYAVDMKHHDLLERARAALSEADQGLNKSEWQQCSNTIRRALEQLTD
jgi:hypothetical protein